MKHFLQLLLVALISCPLWLNAQVLPDNYIKSADGTSIKRYQQEYPDGFYGADTVRTIALTFVDTSWWMQIDDSVGYASLVYGDLVLDSVAVKIKGSSSDFANNTLKKSFDIEFDAIKDDQKIDGYDRTNLHCGIFEPAHVREVVFHWIGGHYVPSVKSNLVHLTINGQNWGAYTNTQQLNKDFLEEWFVGPDGPRWRGESQFGRIGPDTSCAAIDSRDGRQGTSSSLVTLSDPALYRQFYVDKGKHNPGDWDKLQTFIEKLNNFSNQQLLDSLGNYLNVDEALWYLAHEILLGDEDGYVFKAQSDYYIYHDDATGRMVPLEYDGNSCMEEKSEEWSPLHRADDECLPLVNRLFGIPEWRERYLAHCRTIVEEFMHPDLVLPKVASYVELIDTFEMNDPIGDSIYTYQEFQSGLEKFEDYVVDRYEFLHNHPLLDVTTCSLADEGLEMVNGAAFNPTSLDSVFASVMVSGPLAENVYVYYAQSLGQPFIQVEMFDDGMHGDGLANDRRYGGLIPPLPAQSGVVYYFEAQTTGYNNDLLNAANFYPNGAEHEVFTYSVDIDRVTDGFIKINELMVSNDTTVVDEAGEYEDWIELYNVTDNDIDLEGYSLSDKEADLAKWTIDTTMIIPAKGFLIVWCDEDGSQGPNHANFKMSRSGEHIFLSDTLGDVIDDVIYDEQMTDVSYAREIDGTGDFIQQAPTFGITNVIIVDTMSTSTSPSVGTPLEVSFFPNPVSLTASTLRLKSAASAELLLDVYDALGHAVQKAEVRTNSAGLGQLQLSVARTGVYTVRVSSRDGKQVAARRVVVH
ncbi:MAG: CotH kinase family protein [Saprospiraceae bacterium]